MKNTCCEKCSNGSKRVGTTTGLFECTCSCHLTPQEELDYERNYSHVHCWEQPEGPACGQPLEKHKQCCLCDTPYTTAPQERSECEHEMAIVKDSKVGARAYCKKCGKEATPPVRDWEKKVVEVLRKVGIEDHIPAILQVIRLTLSSEKARLREAIETLHISAVKRDIDTINKADVAQVLYEEAIKPKLLTLLD